MCPPKIAGISVMRRGGRPFVTVGPVRRFNWASQEQLPSVLLIDYRYFYSKKYIIDDFFIVFENRL